MVLRNPITLSFVVSTCKKASTPFLGRCWGQIIESMLCHIRFVLLRYWAPCIRPRAMSFRFELGPHQS